MNDPRLNLVVLGISLIAVACSSRAEPEESFKFYDSALTAQFVKYLDEEGVHYRISADGQIFYPVSERRKVEVAQQAVMGKTDKSKKGVSVALSLSPEVSAALVNASIPFDVLYDAKSSTFMWSSQYNDRALLLVQQILKDHGV